MGARLMAIVAEGERGRSISRRRRSTRRIAFSGEAGVEAGGRPCRITRAGSRPLYGLKTFGDLFTPRQLVALTTFSDLVGEAMERVKRDALAAGLPDDDKPLRDGGTGATAYAEAVGVYLGLLC
jgi:putative DNA methylase